MQRYTFYFILPNVLARKCVYIRDLLYNGCYLVCALCVNLHIVCICEQHIGCRPLIMYVIYRAMRALVVVDGNAVYRLHNIVDVQMFLVRNGLYLAYQLLVTDDAEALPRALLLRYLWLGGLLHLWLRFLDLLFREIRYHRVLLYRLWLMHSVK